MTPGYVPLVKAFDEAKSYRFTVDDPPRDGIADWDETMALEIFASRADKTPEVTKTEGILIVSHAGVIEVDFTTDDTEDLDLGVHYYRLRATAAKIMIAFGPIVITNSGPSGTDQEETAEEVASLDGLDGGSP